MTWQDKLDAKDKRALERAKAKAYPAGALEEYRKLRVRLKTKVEQRERRKAARDAEEQDDG